MARSIAAAGKLPFGKTGINVSAALLKDGTEVVNLKIYKQRSHFVYDLIDPSNLKIYEKMLRTEVDINGNILDIHKTDQELLKIIPKGTFFIKVLDQNKNPIGFVNKFQSNIVQTGSTGQVYLNKDTKYEVMENNGPQPRHVDDGKIGAQTQFHKSNGTLWVGTGIPSTEMIVSTDGLIELALGIRYWRSTVGYQTLITPVNNVYTKVLEANGDWTIPFSIGMKVDTNIGYITDFYDVDLIYYGKNDGTESENHKLVFSLRTVNGSYQMVPNIQGIGSITDSYIDPNKRFLQNSSRYKFYSGSFVDPAVPNGQVSLGLYKLKLVAKHKISGLITTSQCWANISRP